jgi:hypothetical protein
MMTKITTEISSRTGMSCKTRPKRYWPTWRLYVTEAAVIASEACFDLRSETDPAKRDARSRMSRSLRLVAQTVRFNRASLGYFAIEALFTKNQLPSDPI